MSTTQQTSTSPIRARLISALWIASDRLLFMLVLFLPVLWLLGSLPVPPFDTHLSWHPAWLLLPVLLALTRTWAKSAGHPERPGWLDRALVKRVCLAVTMPFVLVLCFELALSIIKFEHETPPIVFETKDNEADAGSSRVLTDPVLLYKFNPGTRYNQVTINRLGYREREIDPVKKENTVRIICLGDSVTAQGRPGYSTILHEKLQERPPDPTRSWEAFNMGVYGYTARQGFQVFMDQARQLKPDYITIYYGMNDRNLHEKTDRERMAKRVSGLSGRIINNFHDRRLGKFLIAAGQKLQKAGYRSPVSKKVLRVPPDDYAFMLKSFVEEARRIDCKPILITAARRDFSALSVAKGNADSREEILRLHDEYNDIVRRVGQETGAIVLDLAAMLKPAEFDRFFASDGIHFDSYTSEHIAKPPAEQPGLTYIAQAIYDVIQKDVAQSAGAKSL